MDLILKHNSITFQFQFLSKDPYFYLVVSIQLFSFLKNYNVNSIWNYCIKLGSFHCISAWIKNNLKTLWIWSEIHQFDVEIRLFVVVKVTSEVVNMCPIVAYNWFHFGCFLGFSFEMSENENYYKWTTCPNKSRETHVLYVHKPTYFMFAIRNACLRTYA